MQGAGKVGTDVPSRESAHLCFRPALILLGGSGHTDG